MGDFEMDIIYNEDCFTGIQRIPDKTIDLTIIDPPYEIVSGGGGGAFGYDKRSYHKEVKVLSDGITNAILGELVRVMKKPNIYIWCNKKMIPNLLNYFVTERD